MGEKTLPIQSTRLTHYDIIVIGTIVLVILAFFGGFFGGFFAGLKVGMLRNRAELDSAIKLLEEGCEGVDNGRDQGQGNMRRSHATA